MKENVKKYFTLEETIGQMYGPRGTKTREEFEKRYLEYRKKESKNRKRIYPLTEPNSIGSNNFYE